MTTQYDKDLRYAEEHVEEDQLAFYAFADGAEYGRRDERQSVIARLEYILENDSDSDAAHMIKNLLIDLKGRE